MESNDEAECSTSADDGYAAGRIRKRRFSSAKIQPTRIKKVMQSDEEIGRMVASVPVAVGSAMEHFAMKLLESAAHCVQYSTSRTLSPMHIHYAVMQNPSLSFLEPLMKDVQLPKFSAEYVEEQGQSFGCDPSAASLPISSRLAPYADSKPLSRHGSTEESFLTTDLLRRTTTATSIKPKAENNFSPTFPSHLNQGAGMEECVKRKRGRPRKDKTKIEPGGHGYDNGSSSCGGMVKMERDRLLMPPPSTLPMREPNMEEMATTAKEMITGDSRLLLMDGVDRGELYPTNPAVSSIVQSP